jgi:hypothetical protein
MRAFFFSAFLLAGLVSRATAQVAVGPVAINNNVYGVPIVVSATSWTVNSTENGLVVTARIFADLVDFQRKVSSIVSTFRLPADNCASRTVDTPNPIVSLKSSSLWPRGDQLVMSIRGNLDIWSCVAGPRKSELRWRTKKFAFIKYRVQVRHTWTNLKKNKADTQPFDASLPIYLVKKDDGAVALEFAKPYVKIEGQYPEAILKPANAGINKNAHNAIQSMIDLAKLKAVLPKEI